MLDAKRLLEQFLGGQGQGGQSGHGQRSGRGGFDTSQLGDIAKSLTGKGGFGGSGGFGGIGGGALAGGLAGILLGSKQGRKLGGSALKVGGLAIVGALAYKAYQSWQAGQQPAQGMSDPNVALPPPTDTPFNPADEAQQQSLARNVLRAMIAAAKADGHIDATEQSNIFSEMDKRELASEDKAFLMDELRASLDVDAIAAMARNQEEAAELYMASLLAIDVDNQQERDYLERLGRAMRLDPALIEHLHATLETATEKVVVRA